jgi:iron complex outermembrane recepter protein
MTRARRAFSDPALALAFLALAFAFAPADRVQAVEPDAPETREIQIAQAQTETDPPDPAEDQAEDAEPEAEPAAIGDEPPPGIDVLVVKGVKQVEAGVSASVTQFDLQELSALGAQNIADLARVTPNVEIKSLTATTPTFFIRGVGLNDFSANAAGAVAIYRDDVPINAPALQVPLLFDIENVEILRGPQGYDDNRNASAGAIRTVSRKPTGQYEGFLIGDYGNYNLIDLQGMVSAPVFSNWLSARGAFRVTERDPFYNNRCGNKLDPGTSVNVCNEEGQSSRETPIPPGLPDRVNDRGRWGARGLLRLQPPESEMDWLLNVHAGHLEEDTTLGQVIGIDSGGPGGAPQTSVPSGYSDPDITRLYEQIKATVPNPGGPNGGSIRNTIARERTIAALARDIELAEPFENDYDLVGDEHLQFSGTSLRGEFPIGPVLTTTTTGFEQYWRRRAQDFDYSPHPQIETNSKDDAWQATENLGFEWEPDWLAGTVRGGGYYLREELDSDALFHLQVFGTDPEGTLQRYEQETDSAGVFGNFSWDFLDDFTLDGGVRFNWESKQFEMLALDEDRTGLGFIPVPATVDESWSATTGGIGLTYYFTRDITAYGKYTRGWKGGHIQANSLRSETGLDQSEVTASPSVADPETIDAFEIGTRGQWFDNRLQLGGSLFYYRYEDYQVFVIESDFGAFPQLKIINANDARVFGAEADVFIAPLRGWVPRVIEGLTLAGRFGWIESEFLDFSDTRSVAFPLGTGDQIVFNTAADFTGNRLPNTPRYKVSGTVEYSFDLGRYGTPAVRYDINWTDDIFFDPTEGRGVSENPFFRASGLPEYAIGQRAYMLHDLRVSYRLPSSKVELAFWVRNLEDKIYKTYVADTTVAFGSLQNLIGEPRTYGGSLSIFF